MGDVCKAVRSAVSRAELTLGQEGKGSCSTTAAFLAEEIVQAAWQKNASHEDIVAACLLARKTIEITGLQDFFLME